MNSEYSSFERQECGCVGIPMSPRRALFVHLCALHATVSQQEDRAVFNVSDIERRTGIRLPLNSPEVLRVQSEIALLLMDGRSWRRIRSTVAEALMLDTPR
jgi:hypothetical protein